MVFAVREPAAERLLAGLPALRLDGLADEDARALLAAANPGQLDPQVRDRIVAETGGNPLALLELSRPRQGRAARRVRPARPPAAGDLHDHYVRRIRALPEPTRQLLLLAAADPTGDATLLWRAAQRLGLGPDAAAPAEEEQLFEVGGRVRFRHPLVRSAAYAAGSAEDRRTVHGALAGALDSDTEPSAGSGTWPPRPPVGRGGRHRADRGRCPGRGPRGSGGGSGALAAGGDADRGPRTARRARAVRRARPPRRRWVRDGARRCSPRPRPTRSNDLQRARVDLLRGLIDRAARSGREAPVALLRAARRLEPLDSRLARHTYLDAWGAALVAGGLATPRR